MGEPVLSSWLDPVAPVAGSRGTTDKDLVQRHGEKADEVDARIRTLSKQLRVANAARNELELQIAQLHALGPEAAWRQRMLVAEAAAAAAATAAAAAAEAEVARLRDECGRWSQRWQGLRTLLQAGQLEALRHALDTPPSDASAAHPLPKPALGSTTAPATASALAARVRPEASCPVLAAACTACPRAQHAARRTTPRLPMPPHASPSPRPTPPHATPRIPTPPYPPPCLLQVVIGVEAEVTPVRVQPVLAGWCGKAAPVEDGALPKEGALSDAATAHPVPSQHLELPRSIVEATSGAGAPAHEAKPTGDIQRTASTPSDAHARSLAQTAAGHRPAAPAAEAALPIAPPPKTTAAGVLVPALNVGKTDDFLSRLAAAETLSGERGSSSR